MTCTAKLVSDTATPVAVVNRSTGHKPSATATAKSPTGAQGDTMDYSALADAVYTDYEARKQAGQLTGKRITVRNLRVDSAEHGTLTMPEWLIRSAVERGMVTDAAVDAAERNHRRLHGSCVPVDSGCSA